MMPCAPQAVSTPRQVTNPLREKHRSRNSQYGQNLTDLEWARFEADRQAELGAPAYVKRNGGGYLYVMVGKPAPGDEVLYAPEVIGRRVEFQEGSAAE